MCTTYSTCYKKKDVYRKARKKDGVWRKGIGRKEEKAVLPAVEACMLRKERSRAELSEKLPFA